MTQRSILTIPVTLLAVAALAAPVWASDDEDDGDDGENTPTTPFVQAPAPAPLNTPAAPPAAPAPNAAPAPKEEAGSSPSTPVSTKSPSHKTLNRAARRQQRHAPKRQVAGQRQVRAVRAARTTSPAALRSAPRGGVQAGAGGMARGR